MPYTRILPLPDTPEADEDMILRQSIARQFAALIEQNGITRSEFARVMGAGRRTVQFLLDPEDNSLSLTTLTRAARALGRSVRIESFEVASFSPPPLPCPCRAGVRLRPPWGFNR